MTIGDTGKLEHDHLKQWLETTRHYLFAEQDELAGATEDAPPGPKPVSHGAQDRFISRARGKLLRLLRRTAPPDQNPLRELELAFLHQVSFISQHPDVPKRLLGWLSQGGDTRIRRRIRMIIVHYESRLCRMIDRAKRQGLVRADIEPRAAASLFVVMIQSLALRMNTDLRQRESLLRAATEVFALYRAGVLSASK